MASIKPLREQAMVTGEGRLGLDALPYDRKSRVSEMKVRREKLNYKDLTSLIQQLILRNSV